MSKILYVASTIGHITDFHLPYIEKLKEKHDVFTMAKSSESVKADFDVPFEKKMFSKTNFKNKKIIREILESEKFDVVILNTALAGFWVRYAMKGMKNRPKVINIVHGYLFDKKSSFMRKFVFSLAEKFLRKQTDNIITMNAEDFVYACSHKLCLKSVTNIRGMGINSKRILEKKDLDKDRINLCFIGELSGRKNQEFLIHAVKKLKDEGICVHLNLVGTGDKRREYEELSVKLGIDNQIHLVGYTRNIEQFLAKTNFYVSASKIEGLPFNIMEAMLCKQVIITADAKGCVDLIKDGQNGLVYKLNDIDDFVKKFKQVYYDSKLQAKLAKNAEESAKDYLLESVFDENINLINELIGE
ncbi:MAG: glycosyltransferase [Clostridia bacterium]|nr:glycosyltransferase [Clostridia bacterium]